jgi:tripartite-type tricarboxylate transporter receptor subunit TctC
MKILAVVFLSLSFVFAGVRPGQAELKCPRNVITWVVPFGAGGGTDRWGRILSSASFDVFGMAMRVVNKPGASGVVGWKYMLSKKPNGCTILMASPTPIIGLLREKNPPLKTSQVKIVALVSSFRSILLSAPGKPWASLDGLKSYAKKNPGKLTLGGTQSHLLGQTFILNQLGLKVTAVPYSGTGKAVSDFLGGHVNLVAITASSGAGLVPKRASAIINSSNMKISKKLKMFKGLPMAKDAGIKDISFPRWIGVHPDTPDAIADELSVQIGKLLKQKPVKRLIKKIGEEIIYSPRAEAAKVYAGVVKKMAGAVSLLKKK